MTDELAVEDLVEHFSESVGVEKASEMVLDAARAIGLEDPDTLGRQEAIDVCQTIQQEYGGYVSMIAHDLEVRKQAERRFHALLEHIPDPAYIIEFDGETPIARTVNAAFEEVFGYEPEAIVGEPINEYLVSPEGETARIDLDVLAGGRTETEVRLRAASGGFRDFLFRGVAVTTAAGNLEGYGIYTDITDRKERERELQRQNEQLERFASVVSHDLRNPLNVASGHLELARETGDLSHLDHVSDAHDRMDTLIERLLTLARQGQTVGERQPCDLASIAEKAWSTVVTRGTTLELEGSPGTVMADPERLVQLFENLFRNAVEHAITASDRQRDRKNLTVSVGRLDPEAVDHSRIGTGFYVADDGSGIPAEERASIFDSGYTTTDEGTGLGLAIVESIVRAHGWRIDLADGDGARFEVSGVEFVET